MRKLMLVFLMMFLPLQWTAALAADCCLRHDARSHDQSAVTAMHQADLSAHTHHAQADASKKLDGQQADDKQAKTDCAMDCVGCHAHHCAVAVPEFGGFSAVLPAGIDNTPYASRIPAPLQDNLFRPPLARLA